MRTRTLDVLAGNPYNGGMSSPRDHTRSYFLTRLADELEARGMDAALRTYPAVLRVTTPGLMLSETIDCTAIGDGTRWCFRWSWGDVLHDADDPATAADKVVRVLASR